MPRLALALIASTTMTMTMMTGATQAQDVWSVVVQAGAAGSWAERCAPASDANPHVVIRVQDGKARKVWDRGRSLPTLASTIDSAELLAPGVLRERLRYDDPNWNEANGLIFDTVNEIKDGAMRTIASTRLSDGAQLVRDGKLLMRSGQPVPTLRKCGA